MPNHRGLDPTRCHGIGSRDPQLERLIPTGDRYHLVETVGQIQPPRRCLLAFPRSKAVLVVEAAASENGRLLDDVQSNREASLRCPSRFEVEYKPCRRRAEYAHDSVKGQDHCFAVDNDRGEGRRNCRLLLE